MMMLKYFEGMAYFCAKDERMMIMMMMEDKDYFYGNGMYEF